MLLLTLAAIAAVASARPSYIAVPADQIAFVDLTSLRLRRTPRQTLEPPPPPQLPQALYDQHEYQPQYPAPIQERQALQEYQPQLYPVPIQERQQLQKEYQPVQSIPIHYAPLPIALAPPPEQAPAPVRIQQNQDTNSAASQFAARPPDFGEYVDFGAHTGESGAFGWYADYPVNNHHGDSYRK